MTTIGKYRHLSRCTTPNGHFLILAIDHRANLLEKLNEAAGRAISHDEFTAFKQEVLEALCPYASAVLTDPEFGIGAGITSRRIRGSMGLLAPVEVTNYNIHPSKREIELIPNWTVAKIKAIAGDGVKLLLPYHPNAANTQQKYELVQHIVEECRQFDIPFFLEPIAYALDADSHLSNAELLDIHLEMATRFSAMGVDVLKLAFPVDTKQSMDEQLWLDACQQVNAATTVPWALLSGGTSFEIFYKQAQIACSAGASGVIVGRAIWDSAVISQGETRQRFLKNAGKERMLALTGLCEQYAHSVFDIVSPAQISSNWYEHVSLL